MEVKKIKTGYLDLDAMSDFQGNLKSRKKEDFEKIEKSIKKHGFSVPFFVWQHDGINSVLDGHGRLGTLKLMRARGETIPELPVVYIDCKDESEAKELLLKINSQYGEMTPQSVQEFLDGLELDFDDLSLPGGFLDFLETDLEPDTKDDDTVPDVQEDEEPDSKMGEMYELGGSILMCGDSTSEDDVSRLMGGAKANMIFTDPPYGVSYTGGVIHSGKPNKEHKRQMLQNDNVDIYGKVIPLINKVINDGAIYIFYATRNTFELFKPLHENNIEVNSIIVWNKINAGYADMNSHYKNKYEPCVYAHRKGYRLNYVGDTTECTVWDIKKDRDNKLHPTQKPIELPERAIRNSSRKGDLILDLFGGSGSTLIAAEKNGRHARLMEIDPHYCDVIRSRWTKWAKENGREVGSGGLE